MRTTLFVLSALLTMSVVASPYDNAVLRDQPQLYLPLSSAQGNRTERDLATGRHTGTYFPPTRLPTKARMPNGDVATVFDGYTQYLEVPSTLSLSVRPGHALTVEAWIRPDTLEFPRAERDGYVHWAGKGEAGEQEYVFRMYSLTNPAGRPNRISGYVFNPEGKEGSGSYFQDPVRVGTWTHVAMVIDARAHAKVISLFKNGVLRKTTPFSQFHVSPQPGNAPVRVATRDLHSFFKGAIGKFAIYTRALSEAQLKAHVAQMRRWR